MKMTILLLLSVLSFVMPQAMMAQVALVDGHYVDPKQGLEANPTSNPDWSLMQGVTVKKVVKGKRNAPLANATSYGLPDHVNNGANKYFRKPVANQAGNSCGITSRHSHMMAYELNAYRDKDGSLAENMLPAHFAFVPAYNEDPNKEDYAKYVGIPDGATFGGTNYSSIYGGPYSEGGNNYGRMQGYENWHKAMFNRITDNPNFPKGGMTEEGALAWKRWLYNHNGDESFHAGGIIGIGLASSGLEYQAIASTTVNDAAGVTGLNYLTHWGTGVDHAMVIVGYDDRIEFDLDGDGTYGSSSNHFGQNETGAWIACNSWGNWCNGGFIYVPYALGSPTSTTVTSGSYSGYKAGDTNGWTGEVYKIRKNYVPIRTLKAAVAYSKRSEIQICVGISTNLNATSPDKTLVLKNHNYHGDYNNGDGPNSTNVDADVPMLGQWTDGKLHTEAMEFGYDLTDFTAEFDQHKPLKYFLIINTKSGASGSGQIEYASIMDYELNANGVETPFASKNVNITNNGGTTTISTIVYGEEVSGPDNLALSSTTLSWDAPQGSSYTPIGYNIYQDGSRIGTTTSRSYDIGSATGVFYVTASLYDLNGAISESPASNLVLRDMSSSKFITYIGDPITAVSQLTSGMYVVLKCYGRNKYVYDNGTSNIYPITSEAPEILDSDDYKYVFKVSKSGNNYTFQSVNGYLPALSSSMKPSNSAGSYTVALVSGSSDLFSLKNGSYYLNGGEGNITQYTLDNNSKFYIYPVHVSIPGTNTLNVTIADPGTVYAGVPVQLSLEGAVDIASATWTVAGTNYTGVSPVVTFSGTGSKTVSCTATDSKGNSKSTSRSITVSAAPTATANFSLSSESTTGSDRISFISQNTLPGCTYSWSMPGAEETTATTRNASATYLTTGQKTVTLTVTDGNSNSYTHSETFMVNVSVPKSSYTISPAVVVKNNPVTLTDNTLYDPTAWSWRFSSDNNSITYNGQNGTITPTKAGVYKLTFGTSNAVGTDFVDAERALIVCNSASGQGLTFAGGDQNVTASLSSALTTTWTIDFWFNPKSLGSTTQGITGSKNSNSFTITSEANGVATLSVASQSVSTDEAFYISNEWHHYAITFGSGTVNFYRDGNLISSKSISTSSFSNYFQNLKLGGSSAPMNGSIDEFRVWSTTLSQANIRSYCVAPISASTSGLKLYWQMNQSTGNVTDATSNNRTGTRNNFGPDGDAWTDSEGVFAIDFSEATTPTISATQLNHYYDNIYSVSDEQDGNLQRASLGMAFDGNTSTYYQSKWEIGNYLSETSYPHSFILKRGALHEVSAISIISNTTPTNWSHSVPSEKYGRAKYITIEESDDALNWEYVDKNVRMYDLATNNVVLPWPITKEYVRFSFAEPLYTDNEYVALLINEMNFYGTAVEPTKTKVPLTYVACSDESTYSGDEKPGSNALDGNASTFWHSSWYGTAVTYPHSITIQNANLSDIDMFYFYQQHSYSGNQNGSYRAGVLNVETSSDNSSWTTAFEGLRIPYGNTGYVKLPESINARYIKLTFTRNQSSTGNGTYLAMNEIEAYGMDTQLLTNTVTWNLVDGSDNVLYTVYKSYSKGTEVTEYPTELTDWVAQYADRFVALPSLTPFTVTQDVVKEISYEWTGPFDISTVGDEHYYKLKIRNALYITSDLMTGGQLDCTTTDGTDDKYRWMFFGDPFNGFIIRNYAKSDKALAAANGSATNGSSFPTFEDEGTRWIITSCTQTGYTNPFSIAPAGTTGVYWNQYGGVSNNQGVKYWTANGSNDGGAAIQAIELTPVVYITWNVLDGSGNTVFTTESEYALNSTVSAYPTAMTDLESRFISYPALSSFTATQNRSVDVTYSWTGPFQLTTDIDNPHLYFFKSARYGYYTYAPDSSTGNAKQSSRTKNWVTPRGRWFFTGDPFTGIEVRPYAYPETGMANSTLSTTPTKYIPASTPDITTDYWSNALPSASFALLLPNNTSQCLSESFVVYSSSNINNDKGLSMVVEEADDISMLVPSGLYRIRCMGSGLTTKYWKLGSDHKLYNNGETNNPNTVFRIEENVNESNNLPASYYIAGFDGDEAWYLDNTTTARSTQFTATQTEENYMPAQIIYNAKSDDIPYYAIKLGTFASQDDYSYANTNSSLTSVVGWSYNSGSANGSAWAIEPVVRFEPTATDVFTINNTNSNRGALIYNPDASTKYVWSSGKSGTFDASNANSQWVIYPTGTDDQYYLYNVGADKFAIPTGIAQGSGNAWVFSDNAVAVVFEIQDDGTKKIKMATNPVSGTNAAYMAVSNSYTGPIINYNDVGGNFTITKVDGDASTAANAAVAKLIKSQTALTTYPSTSGWYAIQIKSKTGSDSYAGRYLQNATTLYNNLYPLTFTGGVDVQPAITDPTYFTHIECTSWDVNTWQLPDGRYLVDNGSNKFPTPSATAGNVICGYSNGNYFKTNNNYYADPYNSNANYFIGETTLMRTAYIVYPIDLTVAGLVAWQVVVTNAANGAQLTCTRSDVCGQTSVYNGGWFFLPSGVTPATTDFEMEGMVGTPAVDTDAKTVTVTYNPAVCLLPDDVTIIQGNQTTGKGNTMQPLLRIKATPFAACTPTQFSITLTGADQLDKVAVYTTAIDEIMAEGANPQKIGEMAASEGTLSIDVNAAEQGANASLYYWVVADVKSTATEWAAVDASIQGIAYSNASGSDVCDLTAKGDPDGEMRIYKQQTALWTPSHANTTYYRIPTILNTGTNGIVALTDYRHGHPYDLGKNANNGSGAHVIDVVARRSTDGGLTWEPEVTVAAGDGVNAATYGFGDPAIVADADGTLHCLMAAGSASYASGMLHMGYSKSTDNGASWSAVTDIYSSIDKGGLEIASAFTTGGKGVTFPNGRMAFAFLGKVGGTTNIYPLYSDDKGATWHVQPTVAYGGGDESKFEIMNDNSLLLSVRKGSYNGTAVRSYNRTTGDASGDGIGSWGTASNWGSEMNANGCNADILYYSRSVNGERDVLLHTLTKSYSTYRKDLRLYMSLDQGETWKEIFQLQPGYAAYSSMQKLANGDLAVIYEDGSIGNQDKQDCYAINYVVISKELLEEKIDEQYDASQCPTVTITDQGVTNGSAPYGTWSPASGWANTFTSNATSGLAGVVVSADYNAFNRESDYGQRVFCLKPSAAGATDIITLTAPDGYVIDGYSVGGRYYTGSETYTLTAEDGTSVAVNLGASGTPGYLTTGGLNAKSTTITFSNSNSSNSRYACLTHFTVTLRAATDIALTACGGRSYATLFLSDGVTMTEDVIAYKISLNGEWAVPVELGQEIPASTPVMLCSETAKTSAKAIYNGSATADVGGNLLAGNSVKQHVDGYVLNIVEGVPGFYKLSASGKLNANRAYLPTSVVTGNVKGFAFNWDIEDGMETTVPGVQSLDKAVYDLSGRRIEKPTRGVYIVNGKKVVVK